MKSIARRDSGEGWKEDVIRLMKEEGAIEKDEKPTDEEVRRFDKKRKNKWVPNQEWESSSDGDARIVKRKGKFRLHEKPIEHQKAVWPTGVARRRTSVYNACDRSRWREVLPMCARWAEGQSEANTFMRNRVGEKTALVRGDGTQLVPRDALAIRLRYAQVVTRG